MVDDLKCCAIRCVAKRWSDLIGAWCWTVASLAFLTSAALPVVGNACAFDMVKPERTVIDWIVEADTLVRARPTPDAPFNFAITEVLVGSGVQSPIDQLVDTQSRRKLAANPADTMLFARTETGEWRRVAYVDDTFQPVLRTALDHRADWQASIPQSRLDFIAALQSNQDRLSQSIVIGELDKVPYDALRDMDVQISTETLLADLWDGQEYAYQAIRVLLLGLSKTPQARAEIIDFITRAEDLRSANNLGAFAAALIEIDGTAGVDRLWTGFLSDRTQPLHKVEQIVMALSVHYQLDMPERRQVIEDTIARLIDLRPDAGAHVARQFSLRADWSQSAVLEPLVRERKLRSMSDLLTVSVYLARAREANRTPTQVRLSP